MKRIINISYLSRAFMTLFVMGAVSGCVNDDFATDGFEQTTIKDGLAVSPFVSESQEKHAYTRADEGTTESDENLEEKTLNTLDVFVQHITDGTPDATIMNAYHLPLVAGTPYADQAEHFLAENWRDEGLQVGQYYNIYVAANSTKTQSISAGDDVSVLTGLIYDENEGNAIFNPTKKEFEWKDGKPAGDVYKLYAGEDAEDWRALTDKKEFMMDGVLKNWTPESGKKKQVFQPVIMNRAAAKIVMNLSFDTDFLKSLTHTKEIVKDKETGKDVETWVEKPAEEQVTITGTPAWRFFNFAFGAPVFAPEGGDWTGVSVLSSDFQIREKEGYSGDNMQHSIITYSYPNKWDDVSGAPSMIVSIGYTQNGNTSYHYYRIPIVPKTTKTLDRNYIYVIDATIATRGSESHEDITEMDNVEYEVLPWNDKNNSDVIENHVKAVQQYYFRVNPTVYTLRGDGDQTVVLNYQKATGTMVNWKLFTYDADGNQLSVVDKNDDDAIRAWFYDADGDFVTEYSDRVGNTGPYTSWDDLKVTINQSTEGKTGSKGTVTVTSTALTNKAIKYIRLRVYLDEVVDGVSLEEKYHEDIIIRHFPTDNVQNIEGLWSSYSGSKSTYTLTTTDLEQAKEWANEYGVDYLTETVVDEIYLDYDTYQEHLSDNHYHRNVTVIDYDKFHTAVPNQDNRQNASSEASAVADSGEGNSYYWGENPEVVATNQGGNYRGEWDYRVQTGDSGFPFYYPRYSYSKYQNYYTATYTYTSDSYTRYSVTYTIEAPTNWVDWQNDPHNATDATSTPKTTYDGSNFNAKVYYNGNVYPILVERTGNSGNRRYYYTRGTSQYANIYANTPTATYTQIGYDGRGLNNNHMYVVQISSTSNDYILGRPYVNQTTYQSQDNVVSPAFMIASQLGAVRVFSQSNTAAAHCNQYMEVTEDGKQYKGWRLPTQAEIAVITRYQNGNIQGITVNPAYRTMSAVLTGDLYWCLSGNKIRTSDNQIVEDGTAYLRCVRDLSATEVEDLNDFTSIIEKYRN